MQKKNGIPKLSGKLDPYLHFAMQPEYLLTHYVSVAFNDFVNENPFTIFLEKTVQKKQPTSTRNRQAELVETMNVK